MIRLKYFALYKLQCILFLLQKPELSPNRLQHIQAKLAQIKKENHAQ